MRSSGIVLLAVAAAVLVGVVVWQTQAGGRAASADTVNVDAKSIGGVVVNGGRPGAGGWGGGGARERGAARR
mgnify:CR=1 FL=1